MPPRFSRELKSKVIFSSSLPYQPRTSPCEAQCPAGSPIQKVHSLLKENRPEEALEYLRCRNPFPGITGRCCPHPCESVCNRSRYDEGIAVRELERFAADAADRSKVRRPYKELSTGKKIAIIGSGPAGMSCAYFSALLGHHVTVFEASPTIGGIPRTAAPAFRLPKDVVEREMSQVLELGVRVHTSTQVGKDVAFEEIRTRYDACVIATGAWKERSLDIPGGDLSLPAVAFLKSVNLGMRAPIGQSVVVVGGGGVAFDAAFTARRLGAARVTILCLEPQDAMCAPADEIRQAKAEGIAILNSRLVTSVVHEGRRVSGVESVGIRSFCFDEEGCLQSEADGSAAARVVAADAVLCAAGVIPDLSFLEGLEGLEVNPGGTLKIDPHTRETSIPGLFAAGDVATGASSIANAIGGGRITAIAVDRKLMGRSAEEPVEIGVSETFDLYRFQTPNAPAPHVVEFEELLNTPYFEKKARVAVAGDNSGSSGPSLSFAELRGGLAPVAAAKEADRCFHCGHCTSCGTCVESCPGHILAMTPEGPQVAYPDECWHCGCCRIGCPGSSVLYEFPLNMLL